MKLKKKGGVEYAKIIGFNPVYDLAVLKINDDSLKSIKINDNDNYIIGENVYALGNPRSLVNTFSKGMISGLRNEEVKNIQFTASVSHGSSGGALLNSKGELIGITSWVYEDGQNLNFAVPVSYFKEVSNIDYKDTSQIKLAENMAKYYSCTRLCDNKKVSVTQYADCIKPCKCSYRLLADICKKVKMDDSAVVYLTKAIECDPNDKILYKLRGEEYGEIE